MSGAIAYRGLLALCVICFTAIGGGAVLAAKKGANVTFGDKPSFQSADNFEYALSDDKKAFTITFTGFEVTVDSDKLPAEVTRRMRSEKSAAPVASRVFSVVVPLTGDKAIKTALFANGFVVTRPGSNATLVFSVNGKNTVMKIPPGSDKSFVQKLNYRAKGVSELRMTVFLLTERDSASAETGAFLGVNGIDTDVALARKDAKAEKKM